MEYLAPFLIAYIVYLYNYRKIIIVRREFDRIRCLLIEKAMITTDSDKIDDLTKTLTKFQIATEQRLTRLETKMGIYFGSTSFVTIVVLILSKVL